MTNLYWTIILLASTSKDQIHVLAATIAYKNKKTASHLKVCQNIAQVGLKAGSDT